MDRCKNILKKENLSVLDILELNQKIFGHPELDAEKFNQRHRAYNETAIRHILDYQTKNKCNNTELARHFKLSRNTVAKWKKLFINKNNNLVKRD